MIWSKYKYNNLSCGYEASSFSVMNLALGIIKYLLGASILGISFAYFYISNYSSVLEKSLAEKNKVLTKRYAALNEELTNIETDLREIKENDEMVYRTLLQAEPVSFSLKKSVKAGKINLQNNYDSIEYRMDHIKELTKNQKNSFAQLKKLVSQREKYFESIPAIQPLSNKSLRRIGDTFGMRSCHPIHKIPMMHKGIDYVATVGTKVYATGSGIVKQSRYAAGYGNLIEIDHGRGICTRYAHLSNFNVKIGDKVTRGDCIGYVGCTGTVTGPHLHYEVTKNKTHINPTTFLLGELSPEQYEKVVEVAQARKRKSA